MLPNHLVDNVYHSDLGQTMRGDFLVSYWSVCRRGDGCRMFVHHYLLVLDRNGLRKFYDKYSC